MSDLALDDRICGSEARCFKSYDVRGVVTKELSYDLARRIGGAVVEVLGAEKVVVGRDCRLSSPAMSAALVGGITAKGSDVVDLGVVGTEEVYFATSHVSADAGVMITASHNPAEFNGMKVIGPKARPLSEEEFSGIKNAALRSLPDPQSTHSGHVTRKNLRLAYAALVGSALREKAGLRMVVNAGNGVAGPAFDEILNFIQDDGVLLDVVAINHKPDGRFPYGVPNPLLPENQSETGRAVLAAGADLGVAWDGDYDRCFLFDRFGNFVDGAYMAALLAREALRTKPFGTVLHDARVVWPMRQVALQNAGVAVITRTGHVHMKRAMHDTGAVYGGEMSGHHYFREFMGCDSGMLPWLKVVAAMAREGKHLHELTADIAHAFPVSGEINYCAGDPANALACLEERLLDSAMSVDHFDGVSMDFGQWRLNLRSSSTEQLIRLNIETRGDRALLENAVVYVDGMLREIGAARKTVLDV